MSIDKDTSQARASDEEDLATPLEKTFARIITPFEAFIHRETATGIILLGAAIIALLLANSDYSEIYTEVALLTGTISVGTWEFELDLHHWVNDGLMALFFFVVGLELKREILVGELSQPRQAILPIGAAFGGMLMPALFYGIFNYGGPGAAGWGIPIATDIAFAVGVMVLLPGRVPPPLATFMVALAIVDDLGAVLIIALFYTADIQQQWLLMALIVFLGLIMLNVVGVRRTFPYFLLATGLWYTLFQSGVHATLAGVLGAATVPARSSYVPHLFGKHMKNLLDDFDAKCTQDAECIIGKSIMRNDDLQEVLNTFENSILNVQPPLLRLERIWHAPVAFVVIPVFAFFNAGIPINLATLSEAVTHPVALGVVFGLVFGKFAGITLAAWLLLKLDIGDLPTNTRFSQIAGVSFLAGIGFTMAIFIAELGFGNDQASLLMAKTGILFASLVSGCAGFIWLWLVSRHEKPEH